MEGPWRTFGRSRQSSPDKPAQQSFLFVDINQQKASSKGRQKARSFVMQKARRARPWSTSKRITKQEATTGRSILGRTSTPGLTSSEKSTNPSSPIDSNKDLKRKNSRIVMQNTCLLCRSLLYRSNGQTYCPSCQLPPPRDPDCQLYDPFQVSSVPLDGPVLNLLKHYHDHMTSGLIAVDVQNRSTPTLMNISWVNTAILDAGFMHSFLCTTALHMFCSGQGTFDAIIFHHDAAVSAVRSALSSPNQLTQISDANIGAVFNLLTVTESLHSLPQFNHLQDSKERSKQYAMHLEGLQMMVRMRGGLKGIKSNRVLQAFILWHCTVHAIRSFKPLDPLTLDSITTTSFPRRPSGYVPDISHRLVDCSHDAGVKESLIELTVSVLELIADLNAWFDGPDDRLDVLNIQNFSCVLECLLLTWLQENSHVATFIETALCLALLIFTIRTTEAIKCQLIDDELSLHERLKTVLINSTRSEWFACPDLLLWILSVGAISAEEGVDDCTWFIGRLSRACAEFNISNADTLLDRLHLCGWVNYKLDGPVHSLWISVANTWTQDRTCLLSAAHFLTSA